MEFNEKLQDLRKQKGLTQEELAEQLYVSRTAISKWESGRGYPNIESLKTIALFFSVTVDELLSSDELLTVAENNRKQKEKSFRDLVFGLVDIGMALLLFLPLFADRGANYVKGTSLLTLGEIELYLKIAYFAVVIVAVFLGILTLALQNCTADFWVRTKTKASLVIGVISSLVFIISQQPYAAVFAFSLLVVKSIILIKRT